MIIFFVVVCIVVGLETIDLYRIFGTHGEIYETVINLLFFPVTPIIYGWIVKDKIRAIIVGTVPIFILLFFGNLIYKDGLNISRFLTIRVYAVSLATLGGLAGYFSSKREFKYLIISIFWNSVDSGFLKWNQLI